jgi:uncharacterized protein YecE (DUF72 family)
MGRIRVGCSGWNYADWRERVYPKGLPPSRWLAHYSTFYRLAKPKPVAAWVEATPPEFVFAVKASQYLTHMKRLIDIEQGIERFYAGIAPLAASPKLGPVLWQLPERFERDVPRLAAALDQLPSGRHAFEFRHESWFTDEVLDLLRWHGVALAVGHHPQRPWQPWETTTDWSFVRFHWGRGRRGNYSESQLQELAPRVAEMAEAGDCFAYFNNDWEGFAVANAKRLRRLLAREGVRSRA